MNCATSTVKIVVLVLNVLCANLSLITSTVFGLAARSINSNQNEMYYLCIIGIVVGSITFIVSFFGCYSKYRQVSCFMWTYVILLAVLLVIQLAILYTFHSMDFRKISNDEIQKLWHGIVHGAPKPMADFETKFKCCGVHGPEDYRTEDITIPASCYRNENGADDLILDGCLEKLESIYAHASIMVKATNWTLCCLEATALIFACILAIRFETS